jgi:hypothetical protein
VLVKRRVSVSPGAFQPSEAKHNVNLHTYTYMHIQTDTCRYIHI